MENVRWFFTRCVWRNELYIKKNPTCIGCKKAFWFNLFLRIYDIFKPDESLIEISLFAVGCVLNFFSNIFAKRILKRTKSTNFELKSRTLLAYFCWEEALHLYFTVFTVTVLILFLLSNHWCLHLLQRNPLCDWQTFT